MVANIDSVQLTDNRPMVLKLAEKKNEITYKNMFNPPVTLGVPSKGNPNRKSWMAMDACIKNVLSTVLKNGVSYAGLSSFVGYGLLSNISQEALIRAGVETVADEMTRKPVELYYDDDKNEDSEKLINDINGDMVKYKIKEVLNDSMLKDGFFGGCLIYIDVGDITDEEKAEPLNLDKRTFKKGGLRGFKVIEPVNIAPGTYNTTDPMDEHFFKPEFWYILGKRYHASRFLYIASNDAPILLKPAYNFFGVPQAQMALDYVANFVANRESAQELLNKFSLTCFGTDLSQALKQNGSWLDITNRIKAFNKFKTNNGTFVYNKETEELSQINTPLSGVCDIVKMSLNLLTAIWHIPKIKYIGEGEGGLNASSQEQMRSYYDYIHALQEKVFTNPYDTILKILQLNRGLEPDEKLMFKFPPLWDMDENERAQLNKTLADRAAIYIANGVISQEEERRRLSLDRNSGYSDIDVDDVPEIPEQPLENAENEEKDEIDRQAVETTDDMAMDEASEGEKEVFGWFTRHGIRIPLFKKNPLKSSYGEKKQQEIASFINPRHKERDIKTNNNCFSCVIANELLRRGYPAQAVDFDVKNPVYDINEMFTEKQEIKDIEFSYESIRDNMEVGKRYILVIPLNDDSYHSVFVEKTGGKLPTLYDSQKNDLYALYNEDVDMNKKLKILRVDNVPLEKFNKDYFEYSKEAEKFFKK